MGATDPEAASYVANKVTRLAALKMRREEALDVLAKSHAEGPQP